MNDGNLYWWSSMVFSGLLYGLVTKPFLVPIIYPVAVGVASYVFYLFHPSATAILAESLKVQVVGLFGAVVACFLRIGMEISHQKIVQANVALTKAEEEKQRARALEKAYDELKKREELIRVFVRPSIVKEIHDGNDPTEFQPTILNMAVMFCDIRNFTHLTEVLSPHDKLALLNQYFSLINTPIAASGGEVDKIMGDCVMRIFDDGHAAVKAAIDRRLQLQSFNKKLFSQGQHPVRNGVGIARGDVIKANFGSAEKLDRTVIGEAANIACRLESLTKMYNIEVVVTEDVVKGIPPTAIPYRWIDIVQVKGSSRKLKIFEVYGHQPPEVRKLKDETKDLFEEALTLYFQKEFKEAHRLLQALQAQSPHHRFYPGQPMDTLLTYHIARCEGWLNDANDMGERIEKWNGVHIFKDK
jgi:class 3 adenylate cyclase